MVQVFRVHSGACALVFLTAVSTAANAVVVRGTVTDPLGAVVAGARVQLVQGTEVVAFAASGPDGSYEIRSTSKGRFRLLTSAAAFTPAVSGDFYGGVTDVVPMDSVLEIASVTEAVTVTATGIPTPLQQASSPVSLVSGFDLSTRLGVTDELRQSPGLEFVQSGQLGGATSLFVRGGNSTANKVLIDGITAEDVGGIFDYGTVAATAINGAEVYRGANSVLYGSDAGASVVSLNTPRGESVHPTLIYKGSGGNFSTYRNQAEVSGTRQKLDYYAAFGRLDTSNALPLDKYHSVTSAANVGYKLFSGVAARLTIRDGVSATGLPGAHDFFGISNNAKQADQDLYSGLSLESRSNDDRLRLLARYGITRKREQEAQYGNVGTPIVFGDCNGPYGCYTEYFGNPVKIQGANGYYAVGQAAFFSPSDDLSSNRDELYFQSDYAFTRHFAGLVGFRYENERGRFNTAYGHERIQRTNYEYTLQFQGDIKNRLFYSAGGALERNHLYGTAGTPRIGLAYVPVRESNGWLRGTKLRANAATGVQAPTLALEFAGLYAELLGAGDTADIALYNVQKPGAERSRSYDVGIDQNIRGERLVFKAGYFHNQFNHQLEGVDSFGLRELGFPESIVQTVYNNYGVAYLNSLAFRAQGLETEMQWQAMNHLFLRGGYTYLDAVVTQSFSSDAVAAKNGTPTVNPNIPGVAIGAVSPLIGARPFRRAPHTGFFAVQYQDTHVAAAIKGAMASESDDSTFLGGQDTTGGNTLLLPNHNLASGYAKLDANVSFIATRRLTLYTQMDNLLGQQHIGPIGYPALPFTVQGGLKYRFGGE